MEDKRYLRDQENIYWASYFLDKKWYRSLYGGTWRLIKLGRDTPYIGMFCVWTKMGDECWEGYKEVLATENYEYTGVNTKGKLYRAMINKFIKSII